MKFCVICIIYTHRRLLSVPFIFHDARAVPMSSTVPIPFSRVSQHLFQNTESSSGFRRVWIRKQTLNPLTTSQVPHPTLLSSQLVTGALTQLSVSCWLTQLAVSSYLTQLPVSCYLTQLVARVHEQTPNPHQRHSPPAQCVF